MMEHTGNKYANVLECFLAMLLRPQGELYTPYTQALQKALKALKDASLQGQLVMDKLIDRVLEQIWEVEWCKTEETAFPDPTERFIMLSTLRRDGSFDAPENVTPLLAKCKFMMRVFFLRRLTVTGPATMEYIEHWCHEKQSCTFNTVCDLQHQASAIAMTTQKLPNIFWME